MKTVEIKHRRSGATLYSGEHVNVRAALAAAVASKVNLSGSDLIGSDLSGSDLSGSDLSGSDLIGSDLSGSDLSGSYLSGSDLRVSDLSGSDLSGSDLRGSDLRGSDLRGSTIDWSSHDLVAELLRREAGDDPEKRKVAGLVLVSRDWCWKELLAVVGPLTDWALIVLASWVKPGDNAPERLKAVAAALAAPAPAPAAKEGGAR